MTDPATSHRRWPRYSLRALFAFVTFAAIALPLLQPVLTSKIPCGVYRIFDRDGITTIWTYWDGRIVMDKQPDTAWPLRRDLGLLITFAGGGTVSLAVAAFAFLPLRRRLPNLFALTMIGFVVTGIGACIFAL